MRAPASAVTAKPSVMNLFFFIGYILILNLNRDYRKKSLKALLVFLSYRILSQSIMQKFIDLTVSD